MALAYDVSIADVARAFPDPFVPLLLHCCEPPRGAGAPPARVRCYQHCRSGAAAAPALHAELSDRGDGDDDTVFAATRRVPVTATRPRGDGLDCFVSAHAPPPRGAVLRLEGDDDGSSSASAAERGGGGGRGGGCALEPNV